MNDEEKVFLTSELHISSQLKPGFWLDTSINALILAGGSGSRFHPYTEIIPKPMIPIGRNEKPVLELIVNWLKKWGIRDFVFLVNYKWKYIYNYFGDGARFGVRIKYSLDDEREGYFGTGGAVLKAYRTGEAKGRCLIWYGDILATLNLEDLVKFHEKHDADLTLVVASKYQVPVGVVRVNSDSRVTYIAEKPVLDIPVTIGIALAEEHVFRERIEDSIGKSFDFMGDLVPWLLERNFKVYAYMYDGEWFDVGSLERYKKLDVNFVSMLEELADSTAGR